MEDIKFNKFVCYILNCIDTTKQYVYVNDKYYRSKLKSGDKTPEKIISYKTLNSIISSDADFANFAELTNKDVMKNINSLLQIKSYIKLQYVPDYIVDSSDNTKLNIKQSIYQIFNILKTSFDAKRWYIDCNFTPNKPSPQNTVQLTRQFIGGAPTYEQFLISVINAFISLLDNTIKKVTDPSILKMYILSKINYYIAKQYVKLTINSGDNTTPYKNSEFDKLKVYNGEYNNDDSEYEKYYQKEILDTMNIHVEKIADKSDADKFKLCSDLFNTDFTVVRLFNTIKPFLKKQPTVFYQTPITTYTYNPTNIRPLIYRRASEYDLSNFATQIASDAFLNKNKLPVIYDFKKIMEPVIKASPTGGCSDVNNSSNVYRTIYVKILNILNAKRITLQKTDKDAIETKLNELEQTENYLKEQLGNYAKYVSATQDKDTTIGYSDVQKFLNEYEDKIKEYNSNTAKIIRFIGRLTPYLY